MAEGGVNNPVRRNAKNQLTNVRAWQLSRFSQQAIVGRIVEFEDVIENSVIIRQACKHGIAVIGKLGGDQAVRVSLVNRKNR